jgi:rare lipoprotein A
MGGWQIRSSIQQECQKARRRRGRIKGRFAALGILARATSAAKERVKAGQHAPNGSGDEPGRQRITGLKSFMHPDGQIKSASQIQCSMIHSLRPIGFSMMRKTSGILLIGLVASALTGCNRKPPAASGTTETGIASWYGQPFHGRLTASGETYDMEKMTAAHRTLPFGAKVRVQNLVNQRTVEVRINDRGPFVKDRIIDLSHAAAQVIGMQGTANVQLEVLSTPPTRGADLFAVQLGAFAERRQAEQLLEDLNRKFGAARLVFREGDQSWRVLVGLEPTIEQARALADELERQSGPAFIVRIDTEK